MADTVVPERFREAHRSGLRRFLGTGEPTMLDQRVELSALHRDGHEFPIEMTISCAYEEGAGDTVGRDSTPSCTTSPNGGSASRSCARCSR